MARIILLTLMILSTTLSVAQKKSNNKFTVDYTFAMNISTDVYGKVSNYLTRQWDNNVNINYKLGRKVSLELRTGYKKYNYDDTYGISVRKYSYGIGFNFYFNGSYSPMGNSFGIYYQSNNFFDLQQAPD